MSGNGHWIAFIRAPEAPAKADGAASGEMQGKGDGNLDKAVGKEGQQEAKTAAGQPRNAAVLVEVASGRETVIANIKRFAFGGKDGEWIVLHGYGRSEEHTSELQSLMRRSSDDFCFKTNNITTTTKH